MILERAYLHLSPGFLVFTKQATHDLPFQEKISMSALLRNSPTIFGELNFYGILLYPGLLVLIFKTIKKRSLNHMIILWWIVCYSIVSGIAFYDNPINTRNIVGAPALLITISLFINFLIKLIQKNNNIFYIFKIFLYSFIIGLIIIPTSIFMYEYYYTYPIDSAKAFDYGYKEVANYITTNKLWVKEIYIYGDYDRNLTLSFYSPEQPPINKIVHISDVNTIYSITHETKDKNILIFKYKDNYNILEQNVMKLKIMKTIEYPDNSLAFIIFELNSSVTHEK